MKEINIAISAANQDELEFALKEVLRQVENGITTMDDAREDGAASISMSGGGMEENVPSEDDMDTLRALGYNIGDKELPLMLNGEIVPSSEPNDIDYPELVFSRAEAAKLHLLFKVRQVLARLDEIIEDVFEDDYDGMGEDEQQALDNLNDSVTEAIDFIDTYPSEDKLQLDALEGMVASINEEIDEMVDYIDQDVSTDLMTLFTPRSPSMSM